MSAVVQPDLVQTAAHVRIVGGAGGGPEKTILASPRYFEGTRYREIALYLHAPGNVAGIEVLRKRAEAQRCPFVAIPDNGPLDVGVVDRLVRACREHDVRIWHGHDYKSNFLGLLLQRRLGLRLVSTVHGWAEQHTKKAKLYYALDRWCLRRYEQVVCVSRDLYEECRKSGVPEERLHLIENAIDTDLFRRSRSASEARGGTTPPGRIVIGAVGRLSYEKGYDLLVQAVDRLAGEGLDVELWIAGEGPQKKELEERIAALAHPDRVKLLGFRSDTKNVFEQLDVFALSSRNEGLPQVLLEAMAMEVPSLATRCGGVEDVVSHEKEALLCAPGSVDELTAGLRRLVASAALRREIAMRARARVESAYRFATRMERMREIYERLD